jgi:hypothetical protein
VTVPTTREEASAAGRAAYEQGGVPLHDLAGHMNAIGVPRELQGSWLAGLEDAMEDAGLDTDPDSDGHGWERRALSSAG